MSSARARSRDFSLARMAKHFRMGGDSHHRVKDLFRKSKGGGLPRQGEQPIPVLRVARTVLPEGVHKDVHIEEVHPLSIKSASAEESSRLTPC